MFEKKHNATVWVNFEDIIKKFSLARLLHEYMKQNCIYN